MTYFLPSGLLPLLQKLCYTNGRAPLRWVAGADSHLATRIHEEMTLKVFTVSLLEWRLDVRGWSALGSYRRRCTVRATRR
jgi:hypothetical protein